MNLSDADHALLRLYAKDQLINNLGYAVLSFDVDTWTQLVDANSHELYKEVTPERMEKVRARYNG